MKLLKNYIIYLDEAKGISSDDMNDWAKATKFLNDKTPEEQTKFFADLVKKTTPNMDDLHPPTSSNHIPDHTPDHSTIDHDIPTSHHDDFSLTTALILGVLVGKGMVMAYRHLRSKYDSAYDHCNSRYKGKLYTKCYANLKLSYYKNLLQMLNRNKSECSKDKYPKICAWKTNRKIVSVYKKIKQYELKLSGIKD